MRAMENLEYAYVLRELKPAEGKHFSNAYRISEGKYRIRIGDIQITVEPGVRLNVAKYLPEPIEPDQIVLQMKKVLDNARLVSVSQYSGDRVVVFEFDTKTDGKVTLVFEGFGKGNFVLIKDGKTVAAMREESWSDREIKRGKQYSLPKSNVVENLNDAISDKYVIISLLKLPLGKEYAKRVLSLCGIDEKKPGTSLTTEEIRKINSEIASLVSGIKPYIFFSDGLVSGFSLVSGPGAKDCSTLSEAIEDYFATVNPKKSEHLEKLERRLEKQENQLQSLVQEESELRLIIDHAYANFDKLDSIIERSKKMKLEDLETIFPNSKLDKKKKELEVEI